MTNNAIAERSNEKLSANGSIKVTLSPAGSVILMISVQPPKARILCTDPAIVSHVNWAPRHSKTMKGLCSKQETVITRSLPGCRGSILREQSLLVTALQCYSPASIHL